MFEQEFGNLSLDLAKWLFKHYERALLISTPIMSLEEMRRNSELASGSVSERKFAKARLDFSKRPGIMNLKHSYHFAIYLLNSLGV